MKNNLKQASKKAQNIKKQNLTIYSEIKVGDSQLWFTTQELEDILNKNLKYISLKGLPIRTRSKEVKKQICNILGYPIPKSFKKVQPRFPGQNFDTYIQKSNNLQIWNESIEPERRYVLIRVTESDVIEKVKVATGKELISLDKTGTLTYKYQARLILSNYKSELISKKDTDVLSCVIKTKDYNADLSRISPTEDPETITLLPIYEIFDRLSKLIGKSFKYSGFDQERIRGSQLHRLVCRAIGYKDYKDDGKFPDIKHQLLEIKLQTSPTIDLGLVCPDSKEFLYVSKISGKQIRHCDVRYAIFYAKLAKERVQITNLFLTTGKDFFSRFKKFGGNVLNKKIQIPLPPDFFL